MTNPNDQYHKEIKELIEVNGPMGVNALAAKVGVPLSTMQKYLDKRQSYFKKTPARKWDLPENVAGQAIEEAGNNHVTILESQLTGINATFEMLKTQINATVMLMSSYRPITSVAREKPLNIDSRLIELDKKCKDTMQAIKGHINNVPEEYRDLLLNMDYVGLALANDREFLNGVFNTELVNLLTKQSDTLSEDILKVLEEFQKGE